MEKISVEGYTMAECRINLIQWLSTSERDKWTDYCMRHWLNELGGLAAAW